MNVKELKQIIADLPDDMLIDLEGCDCEGPWSGQIEVQERTESTWQKEFPYKGTRVHHPSVLLKRG